MEGLFLSDAGPKRGCLSYLSEIRAICHTSDVSFLIIAIRYDKHPLFGPALDKNKHSTTRRKPWFFSGLKSVDLFFQHHMMLKKRSTDFSAKKKTKKTVFTSCSGMFIFI